MAGRERTAQRRKAKADGRLVRYALYCTVLCCTVHAVLYCAVLPCAELLRAPGQAAHPGHKFVEQPLGWQGAYPESRMIQDPAGDAGLQVPKPTVEFEVLATRQPGGSLCHGCHAGRVMWEVPQICPVANPSYSRARVCVPHVERGVATEEEVLAGVAHNCLHSPHTT